jgi:hypothetical protein
MLRLCTAPNCWQPSFFVPANNITCWLCSGTVCAYMRRLRGAWTTVSRYSSSSCDASLVLLSDLYVERSDQWCRRRDTWPPFFRAGLGLGSCGYLTTTPALSPLLHVHTFSNSAFHWLPSPLSPPRPPFPLHLWHLLCRLFPAHPCAPSYECTAFPWTLPSLVIRTTPTWGKPPSHQGPAPNNEARRSPKQRRLGSTCRRSA